MSIWTVLIHSIYEHCLSIFPFVCVIFNYCHQEFLLWCNEIGDVLGMLGCRFDPCPAQWVKDLALLQLQFMLQVWLGSDPWRGNPMGCGCPPQKKEKTKSITVIRVLQFLEYRSFMSFIRFIPMWCFLFVGWLVLLIFCLLFGVCGIWRFPGQGGLVKATAAGLHHSHSNQIWVVYVTYTTAQGNAESLNH